MCASSLADLVSCYIIIIAPAAYGVVTIVSVFREAFDRKWKSFGGRCDRKVQSRVGGGRTVMRWPYIRAICGVKSDLPYNRHRVYMLALLHSIWPVIYYDISDRCFQTWWSIFYTIYGEHGGPSGSLSFYYYYVYTRFEKIEGIETGRF